METLQVLSRNEMKQVTAGIMQASCQIYVVNDDGSGYWSGCVSYQEAYNAYHNNVQYSGSASHAGGYCCASCGSGNFSNATAGCM